MSRSFRVSAWKACWVGLEEVESVVVVVVVVDEEKADVVVLIHRFRGDEEKCCAALRSTPPCRNDPCEAAVTSGVRNNEEEVGGWEERGKVRGSKAAYFTWKATVEDGVGPCVGIEDASAKWRRRGEVGVGGILKE